MLGFSSKKQEVALRIETCSSCGKFQKHAEQTSKLIESWLAPNKFTLKTTINAGDPKSVQAFEVWVNGILVHSEQQRNHGYLDSHPDEEHKEAVWVAIQDIIDGNRVFMPDKRDDSEIKLDKQKLDQQKEEIAMKRREFEEAQESNLREEMAKKKVKADEEKTAQKEDAKLKEAAASKEKKQKEAAAKSRAQQISREKAQNRREMAKEKAEVLRADAQKAQDEAQALAREVNRVSIVVSIEEAQNRKAEVNQEVKQEDEDGRSKVEVQSDGERDREFQALTRAFVPKKKSALRRQFCQAFVDSGTISSTATMPLAVEDPKASRQVSSDSSTTAGNSQDSSWEAPDETEKPLRQISSVQKMQVVLAVVVVAEPPSSLATWFGFGCCRSASILEDSAGDTEASHSD